MMIMITGEVEETKKNQGWDHEYEGEKESISYGSTITKGQTRSQPRYNLKSDSKAIPKSKLSTKDHFAQEDNLSSNSNSHQHN